MSEELHYFDYDTEDDEELRGWYMLSIEVDGIYGSAKNQESRERRVVMQPMISLKYDQDATPMMHWNPNLEVDEAMYLKTGKVCFKPI